MRVIFSHDESISERASRSQDDYAWFILKPVIGDAVPHLENELEDAVTMRCDELGSR